MFQQLSAASLAGQTCARVIFTNETYHPIVILPKNYIVNDLTKKAASIPDGTWSIGRYDEIRESMYDQEMFKDEAKSIGGFSGIRDVHVGLDIGGPVGTPVMAWFRGSVIHSGYNPSSGDYGNVIVTEHVIGETFVYSLYGHLCSSTLQLSPVGRTFSAGETLGTIGDRHENGGWSPHVHFQLSLVRPVTHDLPGVVSRADREAALQLYPDPRLVLGPLY